MILQNEEEEIANVKLSTLSFNSPPSSTSNNNNHDDNNDQPSQDEDEMVSTCRHQNIIISHNPTSSLSLFNISSQTFEPLPPSSYQSPQVR